MAQITSVRLGLILVGIFKMDLCNWFLTAALVAFAPDLVSEADRNHVPVPEDGRQVAQVGNPVHTPEMTAPALP
jgi:hypothetical protein